MVQKISEARQKGRRRLFAIAYDRESPAQWHSLPGDAEMQKYLDSREESESIMFNCAVVVVVVDPTDTDDVIESIISSGTIRPPKGLGYFKEVM